MAAIPFLRTPAARFVGLKGYPFAANFLSVGDGLKMHYVDEGPRGAAPVLLLHGEPSWSYLYRKMIPILTAEGHRCIAPDLIGFGKSDKPVNRTDYTYQRHVTWVTNFVRGLNLRDITLVCQDWGGLIGLRVAAENEGLFARIVAANTFLPTGDMHPGEAFLKWRAFSQETPVFPTGKIVAKGCHFGLPDDIAAAYDAPYPDESYKAGARQFPTLVPIVPDDPASEANRRAWGVFERWEKPFLTAFSDKDAITRGGDKVLRAMIPGCKGQPHVTIADGGHFLQEDKGEELARVVADFIRRTRGEGELPRAPQARL